MPQQQQQVIPTQTKLTKTHQQQVTSNTVSTLGSSGHIENTGRWTAEEHRLFLQGLEQHGKGWKKIATLIKSRTVVQIRTHAQKYFQKLAKARANGTDVVGSNNNSGRNALGQGRVVNQQAVQNSNVQHSHGHQPTVVSTAEGDGLQGISIPLGPDGQPVVTMRTTTHPNSTIVVSSSSHNNQGGGSMAIGTDPTSLAAAAGNVNIASNGISKGRKRRGAASSGANGGTTKRRVIGNVVRSAVREGRNVKRQKIAEGKRSTKKASIAASSSGRGGAVSSNATPSSALPTIKEESALYQVPNPLPAISQVLDPYVVTTANCVGMPPPPSAPSTAPVAPPAAGGANTNNNKARGRQQLVNTATHGTLPMAALEDAVFRLLTPATGAPTPYLHPPQQAGGIVDPLAPQQQGTAPGMVPLTHTQYGQQQGPTPPTSTAANNTTVATGYNTSPTGVTDMQLLPSWVDAKNPPQWYNDGSDIDTLLEDADCLNWLSDTGDLDETYPPAMVEPAAVVSSSSTAVNVPLGCNIEPNPVGAVTTVQQDPTGGVVHPSTDSLSFLMDPPSNEQQPPVMAQQPPAAQSESHRDDVEDVNQLPTFLEETEEEQQQEPTPPAVEFSSATEALATTAADTTSDEPGTANENEGGGALKLAGVGESDTNLMGFPDLDMGDESAFVSALLENSGQSTMSFPKFNSALDMSNTDQSSGALNTSTEGNVEEKVEEK